LYDYQVMELNEAVAAKRERRLRLISRRETDGMPKTTAGDAPEDSGSTTERRIEKKQPGIAESNDQR